MYVRPKIDTLASFPSFSGAVGVDWLLFTAHHLGLVKSYDLLCKRIHSAPIFELMADRLDPRLVCVVAMQMRI
jgi:hypothetical protein